MTWTVIDIPVPDGLGEAVAEAVKAAGAHGVSEEWRAGQTWVRGFWHDVPQEEAARVTEEALDRLALVGLLDETPSISSSTMEDQDWLEGWKQFFSPFEISPRLAVTPSWEAFASQPGQAVVVLDPGMAFGTGAHGTTYTCLQAVDEFLQPGMAVCDVGTGSGILAIAAAKLRAGRVVATDNDDLAIRVARDNAEKNGVADRIDFRVADLLASVDGPFDVVIANILAPVVLRLIPDLPTVLSAGGYFISSGYITSQEREIAAALHSAGQTVVGRYQREDWITLVSRR